MAEANQIIHESETQRQYIRLQLPAMAEIDEKRFTVKDLSSAGMAIREVGRNFKKSEKLDIQLILPFSDFTLEIDLKGEIQYIDKKLDIAGCRFVDLTQNKISILNHVIRSFMAGDAVGGDNIIHIVSRENFVNVRKHNEDAALSLIENIRKYFIYGLVTLAIIALGTFIISNILDKLFVVKTGTAQVVVETVHLKAPTSGIFIRTLSDHIKTSNEGQIIGRIQITTGTSGGVNIKSPCDCYIAEQSTFSNNYIAQGDNLLTLIRQDATIFIKAKIDMEQVHKLNIGMTAFAHITGEEDPIKGTISNITVEEGSAINPLPPQAIVTIEPETPLSINLLNRPALVEFHL